MRPRTKRERLVAELSSKLPAITEAQIRWGKKHCFPHNAYRCKDEMWCSECGKMWVDVTGQKEGYIKCPYCGDRLEVKVSRKTKDNAVSYLTVVTTSGDFQVLRHFYTARYAGKERDTHYFIDEVCQQWITSDNKEIVIAKAMNMGCRGWIHTTDMSLKQSGNIYYPHSYDIDGYVYPKVKVLPILRRNGLRTSFHGVTPAVLIRALLGENKYAEMLIKTRQYGMLEFYMYRGGLSHPWAVNICNRNGYIIKDGSMYDDYLTAKCTIYKDGNEVSDYSGVTFKWEKLLGTGNVAMGTARTQVVTNSDVDNVLLLRCTATMEGESISETVTITDVSDPYEVYFEITGITGNCIRTGETALVAPKARRRSDGNNATVSSWTWSIRDNTGAAFTLTGKSGATFNAATASVSYEDIKRAGMGISGSVSATI